MYQRPIRRSGLSAAALLLLWVLAWSPSNAAMAQDAQGLTPMQVAEIQFVTSTAISPDGNHIAYTLSVPADPQAENELPANHLYVVDLESGESTELYSETRVSGIDFRPEHGTISFLTSIEDDGDQGNVLYEIPVDGGELNRLVAFDTSILEYAWNPDGERLAFVANEPQEAREAPLPYQPEVFEEGLPQRRGYLHDLGAENAEPQQWNVDGSIYIMAWSPDGGRLAVSAAPTPHIDDFYMFQEVSVLDAETRDVVAEIDNEGKIGQIVWSPDGSQLALRAGDNIHDPIDGRIMMVSAEGGTPENILPDFEGSFEEIAWTDEDAIYFIASESTARSFGTIQPDGSGLTRMVEDGPALLNFSHLDDGRVAFRASTPEHPAEVFLLEAGADVPERLTNSNPWLDDVALGRQEVVRYSPRDGEFDIEGLLIYPVDYEEGNAVPLIVMVHGGPEAHYSHEWLTGYNMPGQMAASSGYAVFYPNYRGSTGRGLEFIMSSQADLAGKEFDDVVDGVDYLIDEGIADPDRIGVTGGSYGGYATAWMSTYYSDRFAAGVMNVGISNNISKWGTSDIPEELYLVHSRERLWDDNWMEYLERSPIYHVDNAQTPILIAHGAEDTRVHPGQSLELYRHLKVRRPDVPVRLVLYPGEGHGYARSAARLDYSLRMMRWFDEYLMGEGEFPPMDIEVPEEEPVTEPATSHSH